MGSPLEQKELAPIVPLRIPKSLPPNYPINLHLREIGIGIVYSSRERRDSKVVGRDGDRDKRRRVRLTGKRENSTR